MWYRTASALSTWCFAASLTIGTLSPGTYNIRQRFSQRWSRRVCRRVFSAIALPRLGWASFSFRTTPSVATHSLQNEHVVIYLIPNNNSEKSLSYEGTGILWEKGFDVTIRGIWVCWIQTPMLASWKMSFSLSNVYISKMAAKLKSNCDICKRIDI